MVFFWRGPIFPHQGPHDKALPPPCTPARLNNKIGMFLPLWFQSFPPTFLCPIPGRTSFLPKYWDCLKTRFFPRPPESRPLKLASPPGHPNQTSLPLRSVSVLLSFFRLASGSCLLHRLPVFLRGDVCHQSCFPLLGRPLFLKMLQRPFVRLIMFPH